MILQYLITIMALFLHYFVILPVISVFLFKGLVRIYEHFS
jgi:hypothetical protein